jgi:hypothetical protein
MIDGIAHAAGLAGLVNFGSTSAPPRSLARFGRSQARRISVCWRHAGRLRFRTVGFDLAERGVRGWH